MVRVSDDDDDDDDDTDSYGEGDNFTGELFILESSLFSCSN